MKRKVYRTSIVAGSAVDRCMKDAAANRYGRGCSIVADISCHVRPTSRGAYIEVRNLRKYEHEGSFKGYPELRWEKWIPNATPERVRSHMQRMFDCVFGRRSEGPYSAREALYADCEKIKWRKRQLDRLAASGHDKAYVDMTIEDIAWIRKHMLHQRINATGMYWENIPKGAK